MLIHIDHVGDYSSSAIYAKYGIRPSISLKLGTLYSAGDGSMNNPYVVKME